jgi:hypothetical protein
MSRNREEQLPRYSLAPEPRLRIYGPALGECRLSANLRSSSPSAVGLPSKLRPSTMRRLRPGGRTACGRTSRRRCVVCPSSDSHRRPESGRVITPLSVQGAGFGDGGPQRRAPRRRHGCTPRCDGPSRMPCHRGSRRSPPTWRLDRSKCASPTTGNAGDESESQPIAGSRQEQQCRPQA